MCTHLNNLYDQAWTAYEDARPFLAPIQAVWCVETMNKNTEKAFTVVIDKTNSIRGKIMSDLQTKMAEYRGLKLRCDALAAEIKAEVIAAGGTVNATGIQGIYGKGKKTYLWEKAATDAGKDMDGEAFQDIIEKHTTSKVDWKKVADDAGVVKAEFTQGEPTALIKIKDDEIAEFPDAPSAAPFPQA